MASPRFRFFVNGILKNWLFETLIRRDANFNLINENDEVFVPRVPFSPDELVMPERIWMRQVDEDLVEVYYGDVLMFKFDYENGNLIYGFNDINVLSTEKGGTGLEAPDLATLLTGAEFFNLKQGAFRDTGTTAGKLVAVGDDGKLPELDGSKLTNLPSLNSGTIVYFADETPPSGFLVANGALLLRANYPSLFSRIGTRYGAGDGATTFSLPDLRGIFIRGWDNGRGYDSLRTFGSLQNDALQNITGTIQGITMGDAGLYGDGAFQYLGGYGTGRSSSGQTARSVSFDASRVARTATETRPVNIALLPCIKY